MAGEMLEEWKDVADCFFGHQNYQCSNTGKVRHKWNGNILNGGKDTSGYIQVKLYESHRIGKFYMRSHIIAETFELPNPEKLSEIDHINFDITDDNISNLRWATRKQQCLHKRAFSKSGQKGVQQRNNGRWQSSFHNPETNKLECLGTFDTKEEAGLAYDRRAMEFYNNTINIGFLVLNNPIINNS